MRLTLALLGLISGLYAGTTQADEQSIEDLLLGSWDVAIREYEYDNAVVRQTDGVIHVTGRLQDGTYTVLVTISTHITAKEGNERPIPACEGKSECVQHGATEGIGVYSNGKFRIDYYGDNWLDDVFTIDGNTMSGADLNGPIYLTKSK